MAVTQLVPRILEQSLFSHFASTLSGKDRLVRFTFTRFNPGSLDQPLELGSTSTKVVITQNGEPIQTAASIQEAANILGVGRKVVQLYLNHIKPLNSPLCGIVNVKVHNYVGSLLTHTIVYRTEPNYDKFVIPGFEPTTLKSGTVYAFTKDLQQAGTFTSYVKASSELCVSGKSSRGLRNSIVRAINTNRLVDTRVGQLYFAHNPNSPNRFTQNHQGKYPCILNDMVTESKVFFPGLKPIVTHLSWFEYKQNNRVYKVTYDRLLSAYKSGKVLFGRFNIIPSTKSNNG